MKYFKLFLFTVFLMFFIFSCSNSTHVTNEKSNENSYRTNFIDSINTGLVITSKIDSVNDCHACPGLIIIAYNNIIDTITLGQWGNPSTYKISENYIIFESIWLGGEQGEYSIIIYDLTKSLKKEVFKEIYTSYKYSYNEDGTTLVMKSNFEYSIENDQLFLINDSSNFMIFKNSEKEIKISNFTINKIYNLQNEKQL